LRAVLIRHGGNLDHDPGVRAPWRRYPARYGGTETLLAKTFAGLSIAAVGFADGIDESAVRRAAEHAMRKGRVAIIFIETPANPTNGLVDISLVRRIAETIGKVQGHTPIVACSLTSRKL
jgi:methionine-gamma-lyase